MADELKEGERQVVVRTRFEYGAFLVKDGKFIVESWTHPALTLLDFLLIPYVGLMKTLDMLRMLKSYRAVLSRGDLSVEVKSAALGVLQALERRQEEFPFRYNFFPWDYRGKKD